MRVALEIWRSDVSTGEREKRPYEVEVPEWATLLDVLDAVKERSDATLAYRKSCRMMICGSCGMRMNGVSVLACKVPMREIAEAGEVPVISAMGNLPIVKDLVVDMNPFWEKFRAVDPYLRPGYRVPPAGREHVISRRRLSAVAKEALCVNCGLCVSECDSLEASPEFLGPHALAKAMRFVGDPRDGMKLSRLEAVNHEHGIWECTRCYFCNERCPKGVDPRNAIAKLGAESIKEGIDRDMGAKHAKWFVTSAKTTGMLRETELVLKTQGIVEAIKKARFALGLARVGKVPAPFPPTVARDVRESRHLHDLLHEQEMGGYVGIVQGEPALERLASGYVEGERGPYGRGSFPRPYLPSEREAATVKSESP